METNLSTGSLKKISGLCNVMAGGRSGNPSQDRHVTKFPFWQLSA
jgi:hypothetical protein